METRKLLADISHRFLLLQNVYKYRMKKIEDMTDDEIISCCHCFCEENHLIKEWETYRNNIEAQYRYCSYLEQYIDGGFCYDLQMIVGGFMKPSVLPELTIDKENCSNHCSKCKYCL